MGIKISFSQDASTIKDGENSYFIWVKRPEHLPDNPAPISERGRFGVSVWVVGYLNL